MQRRFISLSAWPSYWKCCNTWVTGFMEIIDRQYASTSISKWSLFLDTSSYKSWTLWPTLKTNLHHYRVSSFLILSWAGIIERVARGCFNLVSTAAISLDVTDEDGAWPGDRKRDISESNWLLMVNLYVLMHLLALP
jgi:hypothetical protein